MKKLVLALIAVLALGIWFLALRDFTGASSGVTPEVEPAPTEEPPAKLVLAGGRESTDRPGEPAREVVEVPVVEEMVAEVDTNLLTGTVVLVDSDGWEQAGLSGTADAMLWSDGLGRTEEVVVVDGAFEIEVEGVDTVTFHGFVLGGKTAKLEDRSREFAADEGPIHVRAMCRPRLRLHVLSAETGAHLTGITVVRNRDWQDDDHQHPGHYDAERTLVENGVSPLDIVAPLRMWDEGEYTYLVHSPGFAWTPVHVDVRQDGEREVRLAPGGNLEIGVAGDLPRQGAMLRIRSGTKEVGEPLTEFEVREEGPLGIHALAAGKYLVTVEAGDWFDDPLQYGRVEVEVVAGADRYYDLLIEPREEAVRATLAGVVIVPAAWELNDFEVQAELDGTGPEGTGVVRTLTRSDLTPLPNEADAWGFDFGDLPTGTYYVELRSGGWPSIIEYKVRVSLTPAGRTDLRLELGPPCTVVVRLLDAATGEVAKIDGISWGPMMQGAHYSRSHITVERKNGVDAFEFRAPVGEISLSNFGDDYTTLHETVRVGPGRNEFTYHLDRVCIVRLELRDGETIVPFSDFTWPECNHLDGDGELLYISEGSQGFSIGLSQSGRYVLEIPDFQGFKPVPDQEINAVQGEEVVHVIQLERE